MSRSVQMDYERYRTPGVALHVHKCYECATVTAAPPVEPGLWLCELHTPVLRFCDEVHSEFRAGGE